MKRDSFIANTILLTLSNLTTGVLGFIFSIMLSRHLGAEGMGLYGLVMPVYNLFICLISGGIVTAISKVAAEYHAKNDFNNLRKTIKTTLAFNFIWSALVVLLVFIFSYQISTYFIKDSRTLYALRLTCPAMIFISFSNTLKGYFYGTSKVGVPAFIDIFEKAVRILIIYLSSIYIDVTSVTTTVTAAYAALCIGELISFILLYIYYKIDERRTGYSSIRPDGRAQLLFNILVISLPLCLNGFLSTALSTISTLIVPRRLLAAGFEYKVALSMIGKFSGMALNIVFFPTIVIGSISTILIPDLSQSMSKKDYYAVERRVSSVLRIAFLLGVSTLIIGLIGSESLGKMFYNRNDLGAYIKFAAICCPFFFTAATTYGILNGLGKQNIILRNSLIVSALEVILLYILTAIPFINVYGYGISLIITSTVTLILNLSVIGKSIEINICPFRLIIYILMAFLLYYVMSVMAATLPGSMETTKNILVIIIGFSLPFLANFAIIYSEKRG
ncbi:stage V sporulation protein B [Clostridium thermarum]|uniref:stage V sporulation protein B n=1 Tax=Clostridium thermarum TaxID=1716543 RepID=UPI0013CFBB3E|nr:stage V sporulation protein B [Clostridium thermarum]